ncbi:MAG: energy transducer TonB [Acidobacteriales bacterium]|nr:energy transducer TonB [Terriglobales bacterium]
MTVRRWLLIVCLVSHLFLPGSDLLAKEPLACRPVPLKSKDVKWPKKMNVAGYRRDPVVSFKVKETGEVHGVLLDRSSGSADIDKAVMNNVKTWKFKPQLGCGLRELKMSVNIHFR